MLLASDGVCERDTRYYCARVEATSLGKVLWLDNLSHGYVDPGRPGVLLTEYFARIENIVDAFRPGRQPITALHVGGGGFAYPGYLAAVRPGTGSTVLELDPEVVEIAREELGLRTGPDLRVRTGDARMSILDEPSGAYDLVVGDAFASRSVPWHLTTSEFLAEVRRVLRPDGVYALNLIDGGEWASCAPSSRRSRRCSTTSWWSPTAGRRSGNFVVAASPERLPLDALRGRAAAAGNEVTDAATLTDGAPILTDDFAPVDQLIGSTPARIVPGRSSQRLRRSSSISVRPRSPAPQIGSSISASAGRDLDAITPRSREDDSSLPASEVDEGVAIGDAEVRASGSVCRATAVGLDRCGLGRIGTSYPSWRFPLAFRPRNRI